MYNVKILKDSLNDFNDRLTTFSLTYPRIILAEFNTHRMFARSTASSRAIPTKKIIDSVKTNPFIPEFWGQNKAGMQATQEVTDVDICLAEWLKARDMAVESAQQLLEAGVHKQLANRLLEPFMFVTTIVSATTYKNFFNLRCHADAQPEFRKLALMMREAYEKSSPEKLKTGEWHLPLIFSEDEDLPIDVKIKIAVARCARVSYLNHEGKRDIDNDLTLYNRLVVRQDINEPIHASAAEHVAVAANSEFFGPFKGWKQHRKFLLNEDGLRYEKN